MDNTAYYSRPPTGPFVPEERTYRYLFGYLHLFSFAWIGVIVWMLYGMQTDPAMHSPSPGPVYAVSALFLLIGLYGQLTGWVERIKLGPQGIEWIDWKGQVRVRASLDQIRKVRVVRGKYFSCAIETDNGSVMTSPYM